MRPTQDARRTAIAVAVLVGLVVLAAAVAGPWHVATRNGSFSRLEATLPPPPSEPPPPIVHPGDAPHHLAVPGWVWTVLLLVVLAVAVVLVAPLVRRWLAGRGHEASDEGAAAGTEAGLEGFPATPALVDGVAAATRLLEEDDVPPGDAVIAAWVALEDAAARSGVVRDRAQTASEFTVAVLGATRADPAATRWLLDRYLDARYSDHVLTARDVEGARAALATLAEGVQHLRDVGADA